MPQPLLDDRRPVYYTHCVWYQDVVAIVKKCAHEMKLGGVGFQKFRRVR